MSTSVTRVSKRWPDPGIIIYDPRHGFNDTRDLKRSTAARISKSPPWNPPDQITAYLITCLESTFGDGYDLRILGAFVPLLPQFLGSGNTALGHAVELFLGAWTNSRRGSPSETWLDLTMYNRALRSMKAALCDANPDQLTSTLTALCLLQKTEVSDADPSTIARARLISDAPRYYMTSREAPIKRTMRPGSFLS